MTGMTDRSQYAVSSSTTDLAFQHCPPLVVTRASGSASIDGASYSGPTTVSSVPAERAGYQVHQTAGNRQLHCGPTAPGPSSSAERNFELQSSAEPIARGSVPPPPVSAGGSKPPTAKVTPFVGKSPVFEGGSTHPAGVGEKLGTRLAASERSMGAYDDSMYVTAVQGWGEESEPERVKRVVASLDAPSRSRDQHVTSGDQSLLDSSQRWKAVIESKDKLLAQKSQIIERYVYTLHHRSLGIHSLGLFPSGQLYHSYWVLPSG